ncbi:dipeptidyl aminopeptidase/acylaminoacyl peptidase [Haloactinospora alba]|uniref:Dipeptidyl aminopeptidase/acylaminoacyl peptidase n=1 Tax=Haloactinospora alba TaxID=405555 RepID=A0A543NEQ7_9ACTN|nr:prolyl oligopeptidase family serine peptidase [Haloactinospora alba]TQN30289.1 dipeptidyl aminopeptidase/acylaminoacyl peptidase [Haloactinospora alba]
MPENAPYGTWVSAVTSDDAVATSSLPQWVEAEEGHVWWTQRRPEEDGRVALLRLREDTGRVEEALPAPWSVRNRVHEYGGRPWCLLPPDAASRLVFTEWSDQRLYAASPGAAAPDPVPLTPRAELPHTTRYADPVAGPGGDEVWCVRETVYGGRRTDVSRDAVAVPLSGEAVGDPSRQRVLADNHHFLSSPRPSPDGRHLAWLGWDHPAMPWDGTLLYVAPLDGAGGVGPARVLAGGPCEAVCQFAWDGPDSLLALSDPDGWWNLYRIGLDRTRRNLAPCAEELGGPLWQLGSRWFSPLGAGRYAVVRSGRLAVLDEGTSTVRDLDTAFPSWEPDITTRRGGEVIGVAASPRQRHTVVRADTRSRCRAELSRPPRRSPDPAYLPVPHERRFAGPEGEPVPALVYPPHNPEYRAPAGELPPFLVHVHGGPTGRAAPELRADIAYFTSRGIGVVAVNHGGSTGYGRRFRNRLRGQWGVVDVADCARVARALAREGTADLRRIAIRGGSSGGWTAAVALTSTDVFRCGTLMFPLLDPLAAAAGGTHDFESRYLDSLIGPLPECRDRYVERSPVTNARRAAGPVLLLQGEKDEICPPEHARRLRAALDEHGLPCVYRAFPEEGHGFRKADSIREALEAELSFYAQQFGFDAAV